MLGLMALGLHVAVAMLLTSILGGITFMGIGPLASFGNQMWSITVSYTHLTLPTKRIV